MKKHGPNSENISQAVLRLGTKQWRLRAPLTFLHATIGIKPQTLLPESNALTTRPRTTSEIQNHVGTPSLLLHHINRLRREQAEAYTGKGSNCRNSMDPPNPTVDKNDCRHNQSDVVNNHGSNSEKYISSVFRLVTKQ